MTFAQRVLSFFKSTFIGGLFVLVPLGLLLFIVGKAVEAVYSGIEPALKWLPFDSIGGVSIALLLGIAIVLALCFVSGLAARAAATRRVVRAIESMLLSNLPGYSLMKGVGENFAGVQGNSKQSVLVRLESTHVVGFSMDRLPSGHVVVFVPGVPNALSGTLHIVEAERVLPLDVPIRTTLDFLNRLGVDAPAVLRERLCGAIVQGRKTESTATLT